MRVHQGGSYRNGASFICKNAGCRQSCRRRAVPTSRKASAQDKPTIALIPGLTADGFYVTMHKGAEAAARLSAPS